MALDKDGEAIVFAQIDANLDSNPKIRKAGSFGRQVFEFLLRRNALRGFKGSVPIAFVDPDYLADQLMIGPDDAVTGVTKAVTANLIAIDDVSGLVRIVGWHESWGKRAKEGKERTREWRERNRLKDQLAVTPCDGGDETPSQVTTGDESDAKRREEKRDLDTHIRARERHPDAGRIARVIWALGLKARGELAAANVAALQPWPAMPDAQHTGWQALLDRIGELLVGSTAEEAERVCANRVAVAKAKALADGDGQWFACTGMFKRNSFESWAHLDATTFARKPPKKARAAPSGTIGSATPRTDHGDEMKSPSEVM